MQSHDDNRPLKKTRWEGDDVQFKLAARPLPRPGMSPQAVNPFLHSFQVDPQVKRKEMADLKRREIADIIAAANAAAEAEAARVAAAAAAAATAEPSPEVVKKKPKTPKKPQTKEEREANKEKKLLKLVGTVVVKCMNKYSSKMQHDVFKKYAKEVRSFIASFRSFSYVWDLVTPSICCALHS